MRTCTHGGNFNERLCWKIGSVSTFENFIRRAGTKMTLSPDELRSAARVLEITTRAPTDMKPCHETTENWCAKTGLLLKVTVSGKRKHSMLSTSAGIVSTLR